MAWWIWRFVFEISDLYSSICGSYKNIGLCTFYYILGYGAVFLEETIVAFVHSLSEGFAFYRFLQLISQFWLFNFFAFTGFIIGSYFLVKRFRYSALDLFLIIGAWGLFSEHIFSFLVSNAIAGLLLVLPTMSTYNLVIAPAILSVSKGDAKDVSIWKRYVYSFLLLLVLSIPFIILLASLRSHFPTIFPSCEYIPC